jgi:hypothetical protein
MVVMISSRIQAADRSEFLLQEALGPFYPVVALMGFPLSLLIGYGFAGSALTLSVLAKYWSLSHQNPVCGPHAHPCNALSHVGTPAPARW